VLVLVRGAHMIGNEVHGGGPMRLVLGEQAELFVRLRRLADNRGLTIQPLEAPYVSKGELLLIGWIAQAQRTASKLPVIARDHDFLAVVRTSAAALTAIDLRLPLRLRTY